MTTISLATPSDVNAIEQLYLACKDDLLHRQIFQWDDTYPNRDYFENCIEDGSIYVMKVSDQLLGIVVLDEWQSSEWDEIEWQGKKPLVIHSLMVHPSQQGKGIGKRILRASERLAKEQGYNSIRLDSFSGNEAACSFYRRQNYFERGSVHFDSKPKGHERYICFEKILD